MSRSTSCGASSRTIFPPPFRKSTQSARGTRAKNYLFSLALNPPAHERVSIEAYEAAIEAIEKKLGLEGQPRVVVFHEKDGRRHAHAVWSRIDTDRMRAINMPHFKFKLRDVSRQLFIEHGWQMPRGLANSKERDPRNFTQAQWEQAKRAGKDSRALKELFQDCWAISDGPKAFRQALASRGYYLARGDRRGFVAVDFRGDVYNVAKWVGLREKDVRKRLGDAKELPSIEQAHGAVIQQMTGMLREHVAKIDAVLLRKSAGLEARKAEIIERQRKERAALRERLDARWMQETADRAKRLNTGVRGLWDRITGKHGRQTRENEREALQALHRDGRTDFPSHR
jgi:Relaxase/Mobilisation nuclease domain